MVLSPETRVQILKAENRRLEAYLRGLSSEQWAHPSPCAEWTVADIVAHLTPVSLDYAGRILKTLQADDSDPPAPVRTTNDRQDATLLTPRRSSGSSTGGSRQLLPWRLVG